MTRLGFRKMQERKGKSRATLENCLISYGSKYAAKTALMELNGFVWVHHRYSR